MGNTATNPRLLTARRSLRRTTSTPPDSVTGGSDLDPVSLITLHDYPSADICEPIFRAGERLRLISDEGYRWKVYSLLTKEENYIPRCHVAKVYHGWLFEGVNRVEAEHLLCLPGNRVGSFLIRESGKGLYSLSIKHRTVKHYHINRLPNNWYYISPRLTFQCLEDLVNHYCDAADGLCCVLTGPCLGATNSAHSDWTQLDALPDASAQGFDWRCVNRSALLPEEARQGGSHGDSGVSYGVQNSVSSYLSLAGAPEKKQHSWKRRRGRSVYVLQQTHRETLRNRLVEEEESYEELPH